MVDLPPPPNEIRAMLPPVVAASIKALEAAVATVTERVAELEARLGQNSSNPSRPPPVTRRGRGCHRACPASAGPTANRAIAASAAP